MPINKVIMKRIKYFVPVFICTLVYVVLSITVGKNSLRCYRYLENQKRIISKQTSAIQNINSELNLELTALENDKDVIAAYARKLDYVSEDEKLVKINGLKPAQTTLYDTGSVLRHDECDFVEEKYCKIIGLFFGLLSFIIMFMYDINQENIVFGKKKDKSYVAGIPVYDIPQV